MWSQGWGYKASMRQSLAQKSLSYTSPRGSTTLMLIELKRQMLGAADPQGPKGALGRTGEPSSLPAVPFLLILPPNLIRCQPRPFLQGSLQHTLLFPALLPMACGERRAICLVPALWCLKHRNITWGLNRGRQNPKMAKLFQS